MIGNVIKKSKGIIKPIIYVFVDLGYTFVSIVMWNIFEFLVSQVVFFYNSLSIKPKHFQKISFILPFLTTMATLYQLFPSFSLFLNFCSVISHLFSIVFFLLYPYPGISNMFLVFSQESQLLLVILCDSHFL